MNVALLRVSTDKQDTELQKGEISNYCRLNNIQIDKWIENVESGKKKKLNNMQGIKEIKKLVQDGLLDKLIVYRQDRISRRAIEVLNFIDELNKQGVEIYATNKGKIETDKVGLVVSFMDAYISEIEVENTRDRIKDKLKTKNSNNEYAGGRINFGYKYNKDTKELEINEEEAVIVRRIFNDYMTTGVVTIARTLREEGIKKRAEGDRMVDFSPGSLTKMIDNQIYIGYKEYNKNFKVLENGEEVRKQILTDIKRQDYNPNLQIIDTEVFNKAQELKKERSAKGGGGRRLNRSKELLEGLVYHRCSDGKIRKMYISYNYNKSTGKGTATFKCNDCAHFKREGQKSFVTKKLDGAVEQYVLSFMSTIDKDDIEKHLKKYRAQGLDDLEEELKSQKDIFRKFTNRHKRAKEEFIKYMDGESVFEDNEIREMIDSSKAGIIKAEKQISLLENMISKKSIETKEIDILLERYSSFNRVYEDADFENRKILLRETIDKIIVEKGKIEVIFKLNKFLGTKL